MGIVHKLKIIILTVIIGETITMLPSALMYYASRNQPEGGVVALMLGLPIQLIGILFQLIIIFTKIKDSVISKIIYTIIGFLLAISITITVGRYLYV